MVFCDCPSEVDMSHHPHTDISPHPSPLSPPGFHLRRVRRILLSVEEGAVALDGAELHSLDAELDGSVHLDRGRLLKISAQVDPAPSPEHVLNLPRKVWRVVAGKRVESAGHGGDWVGSTGTVDAGDECAAVRLVHNWERVVPGLVGCHHDGIAGHRLQPRLRRRQRAGEDEARRQDLGGRRRWVERERLAVGLEHQAVLAVARAWVGRRRVATALYKRVELGLVVEAGVHKAAKVLLLLRDGLGVWSRLGGPRIQPLRAQKSREVSCWVWRLVDGAVAAPSAHKVVPSWVRHRRLDLGGIAAPRVHLLVRCERRHAASQPAAGFSAKGGPHYACGARPGFCRNSLQYLKLANFSYEWRII
eukprot:scaffold3243_cov106-Isochrysis_galbana.AAC.8